jgi:hypothetical protein
LIEGVEAMLRWAIRISLCTFALLFASGSLRAANESLARADLTGKITVVYKVDENIEKDPNVGFITVGKIEIRVTHNTSISRGPSDLVYRGFESLKKGATVEVVFIDATAEDKTAKEINILKDPVAEKQDAKADKDDPEKADIRGAITKVNASDDDVKKKGILGTLLVEGTKERTTNYDKASVKISNKTKILKQDGKERKEAKFEDLKKGCKVQIDFTGPVAESYPVQATAGTVIILEEPKN